MFLLSSFQFPVFVAVQTAVFPMSPPKKGEGSGPARRGCAHRGQGGFHRDQTPRTRRGSVGTPFIEDFPIEFIYL